jgi:CPA2 family monovalent cation:H+ antiporter-2
MLANIPFIAIDYNYHTVQKAKREGVNIIYGDPTDIDILDFAQTEHAIALISVIPGKYSQEAIALNAKKLNQNILIMSRLHSHDYLSRLKDLGVDIVVLPEFEASLSIIKRIFLLKNLSKDDMLHKLRHLKVEHGLS